MKKEIVNELREKHGYGAAEAERAFDAVTNSLAGVIRSRGDASLPGVGRFKVKTVNARTGRNPRTGETIQIAARQKVSFKAAEKLI